MDLNFILKIAIGLLVIITFFQVIRLIELSSRLAENKDQVTDKSNFYNGLLLLISGFGFFISAFNSAPHAIDYECIFNSKSNNDNIRQGKKSKIPHPNLISGA